MRFIPQDAEIHLASFQRDLVQMVSCAGRKRVMTIGVGECFARVCAVYEVDEDDV